jgi:hypothetical protein
MRLKHKSNIRKSYYDRLKTHSLLKSIEKRKENIEHKKSLYKKNKTNKKS